MNRRRFLSLLPVPFLAPLAASATDDCDEVTIPVEPCPCDCLDQETGEYYACWEDGSPVEDEDEDEDPTKSGVIIPDGVEYPADSVDWSSVQLPNTGSGPVEGNGSSRRGIAASSRGR